MLITELEISGHNKVAEIFKDFHLPVSQEVWYKKQWILFNDRSENGLMSSKKYPNSGQHKVDTEDFMLMFSFLFPDFKKE